MGKRLTDPGLGPSDHLLPVSCPSSGPVFLGTDIWGQVILWAGAVLGTGVLNNICGSTHSVPGASCQVMKS